MKNGINTEQSNNDTTTTTTKLIWSKWYSKFHRISWKICKRHIIDIKHNIIGLDTKWRRRNRCSFIFTICGLHIVQIGLVACIEILDKNCFNQFNCMKELSLALLERLMSGFYCAHNEGNFWWKKKSFHEFWIEIKNMNTHTHTHFQSTYVLNTKEPTHCMTHFQMTKSHACFSMLFTVIGENTQMTMMAT